MPTETMTPTDAELQTDLNAAAERLRQTRIAVAEGTATADELHEAEKAHHWAETRLSAAAEAENARRDAAGRKRAAELLDELRALYTDEEELARQRDDICEHLTAYLDQRDDIYREHASIVGSLRGYRDRGLLPEGVKVSTTGLTVRTGGRSYQPPEGEVFVSELLRIRGNRRSFRPTSRRKRGER